MASDIYTVSLHDALPISIDTMTAVLRDDLPPLTESGQRVPYDLDRIIQRCVEKKPAARFQSARDLAFALRSLTASGDVDVIKPPRRWLAPIIAAAVSAIALGVVFIKPARTNAPIRTIAVMPFVNDTRDANNDYLTDGITEMLISDLAGIPDLSVVSRASVFRYKGREQSPQQVAKDLKVQAVLTGRVVQAGEGGLLISAELIDGRNNRHLWGERFNTRLDDLSAAQAAISRKIAEQLRLELSGATRHTESGEAYRLYLQGRYELNKRTGGAFDRAIGYFNDAIARDPEYARAWAGLADAHILQSIYNEAPPAKALPLAREAAAKA